MGLTTPEEFDASLRRMYEDGLKFVREAEAIGNARDIAKAKKLLVKVEALLRQRGLPVAS